MIVVGFSVVFMVLVVRISFVLVIKVDFVLAIVVDAAVDAVVVLIIGDFVGIPLQLKSSLY